MVSVSEMAASFANRSRFSARSASWINASTMKACAVLLAAPASRAIRRLRPSGSLRLVADMHDALHSLGSQKVLPTRIKVKFRANQPPTGAMIIESYGHEIRRFGTTSSKDERHVNFRGSLDMKGYLGKRGPGFVPTIRRS